MTFYGTPATGAAWIVPKKYIEKVGTDEFKKNPIGLGPYRVVEHQPGVELVLEANTKYWRKEPNVKRIVFKSVPEATTRLAMLKKREADVAYAMYGPLAEEIQRDSSLKLEPVIGQSVQWISFVDQYEPKSPWADKRVRLAASMAFNRQAANEAEKLGYSVLTGNIISRKMEYALPLEPYPYDPKRAKELLKEAGYPNGFDAGECSTENVYAPVVEALVNDLGVVGIRAKVRAIERAAILHKIQQKVYDEALFIPIFELGFLCASGPRVAVSGLGLIPAYIYSGPFEDVRLKA